MMKQMLLRLAFFGFLLFSFSAMTEEAHHETVQKKSEKFLEKFPEIMAWHGAPIVELANKKQVVLATGQSLKSSFAVVTTQNDEIELKFANHIQLIVQGKTRFQVPQVNAETAEVPELFLFDGSVRLKTSAESSESKIRLKSSLFDLPIPAGVDAIITLHKSKPLVQIQVIRGQMKAQFFDFEKTEMIKAEESIQFEGELDEAQNVKYDYLLDGKKAPHGVLKEKEKFDVSSYLKKEKDELNKKKQADLKKKALVKAQQLKKKKYLDSFLCHKPLGQLDQCFWKAEKEICYRYRCNANGKWGDQTERPMIEKCKTEAVATECDF